MKKPLARKSKMTQSPRKQGRQAPQKAGAKDSKGPRKAGQKAFGGSQKPGQKAFKEVQKTGQKASNGSRRMARPAAVRRAGEKKDVRPSRTKLLSPRLGSALLWGVHAVQEAWLNPQRRCSALLATESGLKAIEKSLRMAEKEGIERPTVTVVERADIEACLPKGSVHQGLALEVKVLPETSIDDLLGQEKEARLVLILDQVTDPHNVGAILRSAAAFGADAVIVTERNAPAATGVLAKAACGAMEHVPVIPVVNLARAIKELQAESFWCIGLAEEGEKELTQASMASGRVALVLGAEGDGLRRLTREHCDELARLPTQGPIGSLNVSNAAAVALYEVKRQRQAIAV